MDQLVKYDHYKDFHFESRLLKVISGLRSLKEYRATNGII